MVSQMGVGVVSVRLEGAHKFYKFTGNGGIIKRRFELSMPSLTVLPLIGMIDRNDQFHNVPLNNDSCKIRSILICVPFVLLVTAPVRPSLLLLLR
jgi:hypothetical protein